VIGDGPTGAQLVPDVLSSAVGKRKTKRILNTPLSVKGMSEVVGRAATLLQPGLSLLSLFLAEPSASDKNQQRKERMSHHDSGSMWWQQ